MKLSRILKLLVLICIYINTDYRVIGYYRSSGLGSNALVYLSDSVKCLQALCSTDKITVILGDFNLPNIDWSCYHCPGNPVYNEFLKFVNTYGFHQFVTEPTRDCHILDLVLSTSSSFVSALQVTWPISTNDHNTVVFRVNGYAADSVSEPFLQRFRAC